MRVPAARGLGRVRLDGILGTVFDHRLALVVAPAGSGKTTLLAHFAAGAGCPVAWYRAEASDTGVAALLRNLELACGEALEGLATGWSSVEDAAAALEAHAAPRAAIVVDDLHTLYGTPAEAALEQLLGYLPAGIAVVVATRRSPSFALSRLRVQGDLLEVGTDDLRFRAWEVEQLFKVVYRQALSPSDLSTLTRRTEGWAAGLQLFHLATQGKSVAERHRLVEGLGARTRLVREYLADNVLGELPDDLRLFLVGSCVLSTLSGELCDELLGGEGSDAVLADLERRQLFCVPLDQEGLYRYHEVLRSHLEAALVEQVGEAAARDRYRAAGTLHEKTGDPVGAIRAYCRAEDWAAVGRLLGAQSEALVGDPGAWVDALPPALVADDPWLVLASARRAVASGRLRDAFSGYAEAEKAFGVGRGAESARTERGLLRPWMEPRPDRQPGWSGLLRAATIRDAATVAREAAAVPGALGRFVEGVAAVLAGRADEGQALLLRAAEHPEASQVVEFVATAAAALATLWGASQPVDAGRVEDLADALGVPWAQRLGAAALALLAPGALPDESRRPFDVEADDWGGALCALHAGLAFLRDGVPAVVVLDEAVTRLRFLGADLLEAHAAAALAHALAAEGRPEALEAARQAADEARRLGAHGAALRAQLAAAAADPAGPEIWTLRARRSAASFGLPAPPVPRAEEPPAPPPVAPAPAVPGPGKAAAPPLRLQVLGQFCLEVGGRLIDLSGVKPRARTALRLLALHAPRPVHREVLCEALWPEADLDSATRNLQVVVSSLRQSLEPGVARGAHTLLVRDGDAYRLALPEGSVADLVGLTADVAAGRLAHAAGDRGAAIDAFQRAMNGYGDLLPEDGPAEWVVGERNRVRLEVADVAARLATLRLEAGDADAACAAAEGGLRVDRYRDDLWRHLIDAHRAQGDQAAAARVERDYALVLEELGVT
ncbi:MAG: BTAD domain-containing putative transcriptional regulator [Acidimicrobiales bacterium]